MRLRRFSYLLILLAATGCISTKNEVEVKPVEIHVTVDINVKIQMEQELEKVFMDLDNTQDILEDEGEEGDEK